MDILQQIGVERWRLKKSLDSKPVVNELVVEGHRLDQLEEQQAILKKPELAASFVTEEKGVSVGLNQIDEVKLASELEVKSELNSEIDLPTWHELEASLNDPVHCQSCAQSKAILGQGDATAKWVFIMDAPSSQDSHSQQLLSGRNGQLFESILKSIGLSREQVYLTSVFKCPPPDEVAISPQCGQLVNQQLRLIKPKVVIALGEFAAQTLMRSNHNLSALRKANPHSSSDDCNLIASHSIVSMLETPILKAEFWQDIKKCLH